jgi:type IV secretion system pilin
MGANILNFFAAGQCNNIYFLGLKPWYYYINLNSSCQFDATHQFQLLGSNSDLLLIILAVIDDLLIVAGLAAVIFVIYSGIRYITSQGSPSETASALSTLIYALVGLAIALIAIPTVSYIGSHYATGSGTGKGSLDLSSLPNPGAVASGGIIPLIFQDVFGIVGGLSLLFLIIGGFRYVLSSGEPQNVATAKATILYAIIGLLIAIVAESIVSLILGKF